MKMAVDAVEHIKYIAKSRASIEALKSANLLKSLNINAIILGENGVGKEELCRYILPDAQVVEGNDLQEILGYISTKDNVIIKNFNQISNFQKVKSAIEVYKTRIIATSTKALNEKIMDDFFSLKITIPPLREREEDIKPLAKKFFEEVSHVFGEDKYKDISLDDFKFDISENCYSLRKSVYLKYLIDSFSEEDVMLVMEEFLSKKIGGRNDYRDQLHLFDVPLIRSGFKKFHSQLAMSERFGLNRNTLRKKINEYKDRFGLEE
jgi:DNA-binding NtrC family response regulator